MLVRIFGNNYLYQYKDHLGNVRVTYKNNAGIAQIVDQNDYYAFGMNMMGDKKSIFNTGSYYNYKFGQKELQENGFYDFGARMYMADLGRWNGIDPLAEDMRRHSPYNYAFNNPISFIDPDGMKAVAPQAPMEMLSPSKGMFSYYASGGRGDTTSILAFLGLNDHLSSAIFDVGYGGGGGGNASPNFQFPKGQEEYYKKNYPAFYDLVKNILPNILKDSNYLKALMDVTGMSKEALEKAFTYGDGPTLHANNIWSDGFYDYSGSHAKEDLNSISIDIVKVLNWYEKANRDPNTKDGVANIFYMTALVGHETGHWGNQIKGPSGAELNFLHKFNNTAGEPEHGNAFEFKLFNGLYPKAVVANGILDIGHANTNLSKYLYNYVSTNFKILSSIFQQK